MLDILFILFSLTLVYLSTAERFNIYARLIAMQGVILFLVSLLELSTLNIFNFLFILIETLVFKGILVPYFLFRIIKKTNTARVHETAMPGFYSLLFVMAGLVISIALAFGFKNQVENYFSMVCSLFALYTGFIMIVGHKKIFSHLIGFLVIENGVFLFALGIGSKFPMLINAGIMLDVFVSVLVLSMFVSRVAKELNDLDAEILTKLKG